MLAAKVPAINRGTTWPIAKLPRKIVPVRGFPSFAIQARSTARTGVEQGEEARPKARPADTGAKTGGTLDFQISGSGPNGRDNFKIPIRLSPIINANKLINSEKKLGS